MIKNRESLSMTEAVEIMKKSDTDNPDFVGFIKKFELIKPDKAKQIREEIQGLNLLKINSEHISKIIDLMPENEVDLNKIFVDVSLDKDETTKILEIIKKFK